MRTIVLDYTTGEVYILNGVYCEDEIENALDQYSIKVSINNCYYMTVQNELKINIL